MSLVFLISGTAGRARLEKSVVHSAANWQGCSAVRRYVDRRPTMNENDNRTNQIWRGGRETLRMKIHGRNEGNGDDGERGDDGMTPNMKLWRARKHRKYAIGENSFTSYDSYREERRDDRR